MREPNLNGHESERERERERSDECSTLFGSILGATAEAKFRAAGGGGGWSETALWE